MQILSRETVVSTNKESAQAINSNIVKFIFGFKIIYCRHIYIHTYIHIYLASPCEPIIIIIRGKGIFTEAESRQEDNIKMDLREVAAQE